MSRQALPAHIILTDVEVIQAVREVYADRFQKVADWYGLGDKALISPDARLPEALYFFMKEGA